MSRPAPLSAKRLLGLAVFGLDRWLQRQNRVFEYSTHPRCLYRIQLRHLERDVVLSDGTRARRGDPLIELHLWSERVPLMRQGASIGWAREMSRCLETSLRELAAYLAPRPEFDRVRVLRAQTALGGSERNAQIARLKGRYGFELIPDTSPVPAAERALRFGQNLLISLMVVAHNPASLRADTLRRDRTPLFMSREVLDHRYGTDSKRRRPGAADELAAPAGASLAQPAA